jgi:putative DNA primase/helicase
VILSDFLARFAEVEEERDGYRVPCPAHADGRPSLRVALSDEGRILLRCRAGCATKDVVGALGLSFADLFDAEAGEGVKATSARVEAPGPRDIAALAVYLGETAERLQDGSPAAQEALAYATRRFGVDADTARALGLGVDPGGRAHAFEYLASPYRRATRLVVPFRDFDGVARGLQGRALADDPVRWCGPSNPEGAAWAKVGVFTLDTGSDTLVITEGPGDALTSVGVGYDAAFIRGAALAGNAEAVDALVPHLQGRRIVVAGDRDGSGRAFTDRISARLAGHGLQVHALTIPEEPEDGDLSGWRKHNPGVFPAAFRQAVREAALVAAEPPPSSSRPPKTEEEDGYAQTDLGNAERLFDHLDGLIRYAAETGFYLWDGSVWVADRFDAVRTSAHEVVRAMVRDAQALLDAPNLTKDQEADGKRLLAWGLRSQSSRSLDAMLKEVAAMPGVALDVEKMDSRHDLLAFRNGTVDLRTGAVRPHAPADLMTRKIDVEYDPTAAAPTWDYFLGSVFPDHPDLPGFVQRLVGYGITGHTREQCFAVLWGTGSNGKSVFTDTLTSVFRAVTVTTPFSTFESKPNGGIPNDLAALKGARLVMASEGDQGRPMAEAVIKRITGRDLISARFMRKEFFEFAPTFLIFLATNYKPNFRGQDEGLWRRVKLVPWARYFAAHERDHYLPEKLLAEAPGIVAWAVRGAMEWYSNGLQEPDVVRTATRDYRETSDALQGFLPGRVVREEGAALLGSEAYLAYREWCQEEGLREGDIWKRKTFYGALDERGIPREKRNVGVVLLGVRLARPGETPEATEASGARAGAGPTAKVPGTTTPSHQAPNLDDVFGAPA